MTIELHSKTAIDYRPCRYGASRLAFRGPARSLEGSYLAALGGSETFGKFVADPYVDLLERTLQTPVVNLGVMQAGLTLFLDDPGVLTVASNATLTIVQVLGAQNMSNRFYSVHPRRNDRFLKASDALQALYPHADFTEFNFTGHLLRALETGDPRSFGRVVDELKTAWVRRMTSILNAIEGEKLLLWMSDRTPEQTSDSTSDSDPLFVDRHMLTALSPLASGLVEVVATDRMRSDGLKGKSFLPGEEAAAEVMPGPRFHAEVAEALATTVQWPGAGSAKRRSAGLS